MKDLEALLQTNKEEFLKEKARYDYVSQRYTSIKKELTVLEEEKRRREESIYTSAAAYERKIIQELIETATQLEKRDILYQKISSPDALQEKKDQAIFSIFEQYADISEILSPLEEKYRLAKERKREREGLQETIPAAVVISQANEHAALYLSVAFKQRDTGLMASLTTSVKQVLERKNLAYTLENVEGILKIVLPSDKELYTLLSAENPVGFNESHIAYTLFQISGIEDILVNHSSSLENAPEKREYFKVEEKKAFLLEKGFTTEEIESICLKYKQFKSAHLPTIKKMNDVMQYFLEEKGLERIIFLKSPLLFQRDRAKLQIQTDYLFEELNLTRKEIYIFPEILGLTKDHCQKKVDFLREKEFPLDILKKKPQILGYSLKKLVSQMHFLQDTCTFTSEDIYRYPQLLGYSLKKRLEARRQFLLKRGKDISKKKWINAFIRTDEKFCRDSASSSVEEYQEFLERNTEKEEF